MAGLTRNFEFNSAIRDAGVPWLPKLPAHGVIERAHRWSCRGGHPVIPLSTTLEGNGTGTCDG